MMWYSDILVGIIVSCLWIWLVLIVSQGRLIQVNSKRTHEKSSKSTHERRNEPHHENEKKKD